MCGITGLINIQPCLTTKDLQASNNIIRHRGPDDEGYLIWNGTGYPKVYGGEDTATDTIDALKLSQLPNESFNVALGHRRLSILDLSPAGHQPMLLNDAGLAISFNGEIYNYIEIREELKSLGHTFVTGTDTEVILHAWQEWGKDCLSRFNGMFAFLILDWKNYKLFAVRDRFGVKPLYYSANNSYNAFASEQKQLKTLPLFERTINTPQVLKFLSDGSVDHSDETFYDSIKAIPAGAYAVINLNYSKELEIYSWYQLPVGNIFQGTEDEAVDKFRSLLTDSIRLRLRADVKVGSCLSGGLDSSSIVCIASEILNNNGDYAGQETVTSCFADPRFDEWNYAKEAVEFSGAHPHKIYPSFEQLILEADKFLWHLDEPVASTSPFSQWAVFKATNEANLKVMIDGQGADEQLAGYSGNERFIYARMLRQISWIQLLKECGAYKKRTKKWPYLNLLAALQVNMGDKWFPKKLRLINTTRPAWIKPELSVKKKNNPHSLKESLNNQVKIGPLPSLLRYEDRNSMAWSVESRTPFMDYRLIEFTNSLPDHLLYSNGTSKVILRKAVKHKIPEAIRLRKDKMGFVSPEEIWFKNEGRDWFWDGVEKSIRTFPEWFHKKIVFQMMRDMESGKITYNTAPWRILTVGKWVNQ